MRAVNIRMGHLVFNSAKMTTEQAPGLLRECFHRSSWTQSQANGVSSGTRSDMKRARKKKKEEDDSERYHTEKSERTYRAARVPSTLDVSKNAGILAHSFLVNSQKTSKIHSVQYGRRHLTKLKKNRNVLPKLWSETAKHDERRAPEE